MLKAEKLFLLRNFGICQRQDQGRKSRFSEDRTPGLGHFPLGSTKSRVEKHHLKFGQLGMRATWAFCVLVPLGRLWAVGGGVWLERLR